MSKTINSLEIKAGTDSDKVPYFSINIDWLILFSYIWFELELFILKIHMQSYTFEVRKWKMYCS